MVLPGSRGYCEYMKSVRTIPASCFLSALCSGKCLIFQYCGGLLLLLLIGLYSYSTQPFGFLGSDTDEYLQTAEEMLSGSYFTKRPVPEIPSGSLQRTPVFPALLGAAKLLSSDNFESALWILHTILILSAYLAVAASLSRIIPPAWSTVAFVFLLLKLSDFYLAVTSEWTALSLLMMTFAAVISYECSKSARKLGIISALVSLLVLTRPVFVPVLAMPLLMFIRNLSWRKFIWVALGMSPVMFWLMFNLHRIESLSIAPLDGRALFAIGSVLGPVSTSPEDDASFVDFVKKCSEQFDWFFTREQIKSANSLQGSAIMQVHQDRVGQASLTARSMGLSTVKTNQLMRKYSLRAISRNLENYAFHIKAGLSSLLESIPLLVPSVLLPLFWLKAPMRKALGTAILWLFVIHIIEVFLVVAMQFMTPRYYALTYYPVCASSFLVLYLFASDICSPDRGRI